MSDRNRIDINKKKLDKKYIPDEDKKIKNKAIKQFKQRKFELEDEDSLEELENYK